MIMGVGQVLQSLSLLTDASRVRILLLLEKEELSVAELQEILAMGQSRISMQLAKLKSALLVEDRRVGKSVLYRLKQPRMAHLFELLRAAAKEIPECEQDRDALRLALRKRQDKMRRYFDELAGRFGRQYVPGRSWQGLAEMLLRLMPSMTIADLGAGEGTFSQLLAKNAKRVIAVDNSEKMVEFGAGLARRNGIKNLDYRHGDLEALPIPDKSIDLAFLSQSLHHAQHPPNAVAEAWRILKSGGRIVVLDLVRHNFERARELYADLWLGFTEVELRRFLRDARFKQIETALVHREPEAPHFETLLGMGVKG